jgi:hypothetical protein
VDRVTEVQRLNEEHNRQQAEAANHVVFAERPKDQDVFGEFAYLESLYFGGGAAPRYRRGDRVQANYQSSGRWLPAEIASDGDDGTFDIVYAGGLSESGVPVGRIRRLKELAVPAVSDAPVVTDLPGAAAAVGGSAPDEQERLIREQVEFVSSQYLTQSKQHRTRRAADYADFEDGEESDSERAHDSAFGFRTRLVGRLQAAGMGCVPSTRAIPCSSDLPRNSRAQTWRCSCAGWANSRKPWRSSWGKAERSPSPLSPRT